MKLCLCGKYFCLKCATHCGACADYHREQCFHLEKTFDNETWHYAICQACHQTHCLICECDVCKVLICESCCYYCVRHSVKFCPSCQTQCQNGRDRCRKCHLTKCGLCWKPSEFKFLSEDQQNQILTLTLAFKHLRPAEIIPPKFVRHIIFRHLIHPDQRLLTTPRRPRPPMVNILCALPPL